MDQSYVRVNTLCSRMLKDPQSCLKELSNDDFLHSCIYREVYSPQKVNSKISKNPIISRTLGNKINIFTSRQSKTKDESCFSSYLLLPWTDIILKICVHKKLWCSILSNICDVKCAFNAKGEGAHSFGIILNEHTKVNFTKLCTGKSAI